MVKPATNRHWKTVGCFFCCRERIRQSKRNNAEFSRANEILKTVSAFSRRNQAVPQQDDPISRYVLRSFRGQGPLSCLGRDRAWVYHLTGLPVAKTSPTSARVIRDAVLILVIKYLHQSSKEVYGVHKMWHVMRRSGWLLGEINVPGSCAKPDSAG